MTELPAIAAVYGIRPWEVERLTFSEVRELVDQFQQIVKLQSGWPSIGKDSPGEAPDAMT